MPEISSSIITWSGAIIVALIGVYFSRRKTSAEVADKISLAAGRSMDRYEKQLAKSDERIKRLEEKGIRHENKMDVVQSENRALRDRVSSLEENDRTTRLAMEILENEYTSLQNIMKDWHAGIMILIDQIERHDSSPEWRPKDK